MCYDIKASYEAQLKRAQRRNDFKAIEEIMEKLLPLTDLPLHHVSGFTHPKVFIYTDRQPDMPEVATWGLVPNWVKEEEQIEKIWNNTLNARGETIFEKPSFRKAARGNRCIIYVDGFYEHHHFNKKTYPFLVQRKDEKPLALGGLWNDWVHPDTGECIKTFSIVTTVGNSLMAKIHNNPKITGPRMPLILQEEWEEKWLEPIKNNVDVQSIQALIEPLPNSELKAHTVHRLRGKEYLGNVPEIAEVVNYEELEF